MPSRFPHDDNPIFVDNTLRRRRLVMAGGTAAGAALILAALAMVSGFTSTGPHQPPAWPAPGHGDRYDSPAASNPPTPRPTISSPSRKAAGEW